MRVVLTVALIYTVANVDRLAELLHLGFILDAVDGALVDILP
jgi:hypothetical protein